MIMPMQRELNNLVLSGLCYKTKNFEQMPWCFLIQDWLPCLLLLRFALAILSTTTLPQLWYTLKAVHGPNLRLLWDPKTVLAENKMENDPTLSMSCPHLSRNHSLTTLTNFLPIIDHLPTPEKRSFTGIFKGKSAYLQYLPKDLILLT